jgi:hypothetical protein
MLKNTTATKSAPKMDYSEITWNTSDLSLDWIAQYFSAFPGTSGAQHVAFLLGHGAAFCSSRALGCWMANDREGHAIYRSLAKHASALKEVA